MRLIERLSAKTVAVGLLAFIVLGGFAVALLQGTPQTFSPAGEPAGIYASNAANAYQASPLGSLQSSLGNVFGTSQTVTMTSTMTMATTSSATAQPGRQTVVVGGATQAVGTATQGPTSFNQPGNGSLIEFFSNMTMESPDPSGLAAQAAGLAYSVGGYVAYQSTTSAAAYLVIRVPASGYQQVLNQIRGMGNVTSLTSNSNDVTVKYTDLNATLASLVVERNDLMKLVSQSTQVNNTLAIEAQIQSVNAQINSVQSEILQTQRLITYSTITLSITKAAEAKPLSMTLSATPKSGVSPVGVTFNAVVTGGQQPYIVNYNFGDGTSEQGQAVIHQFYSAGEFNVTVSATDAKGNVTMAWALIHVTEPPTSVGFGNFGATIEALMIHVVEGMAEIAVVIVPIALVAAAVIYPFARRNKAPKEIRQS